MIQLSRFSTLLLILLLNLNLYSKDSLSLVFAGDIMGHGPQIKSAYNSKIKSYDYNPVFSDLESIINNYDIPIGNLELTLAGKPYKGYPTFSSPDALAQALKYSGFKHLVTANNHSCDRRKKGINRTIDVLDKLKIEHTGTFKNNKEREKNNLMLIEKNNIKLGILNYTYGTNGIPVPKPCVVNLIDLDLIRDDIAQAKKKHLDKLIVFLHWGYEYKSLPNSKQKIIADSLYSYGVDIIIGSHPHVIQPIEYKYERDGQTKFLAYSLGNFVSNQRARRKDGGLMVGIKLIKNDFGTFIEDAGYHLVWVDKYMQSGNYKYVIRPCSKYEKNNFSGLSKSSTIKMKQFIKDSRKLMNKHGINAYELDK
jgi:poly-gamma-glutamate synthesis protein (capsule biosynthesis protein)